MNLTELQFIKCSCDQCKKMCKCPCWPTPEEADKLIENGYADMLMLDYWSRYEEGDIYIISPAEKGREKSLASFMRSDGCVMQDKDGLCILHNNGLKPIEGKAVAHNHPIKDLHRDVAYSWDTDEGKAIVAKWKKIVKYYH